MTVEAATTTTATAPTTAAAEPAAIASKAERRAQAVAMTKGEDAPAEKPAEAPATAPAEKPAERPSAQLAAITREHKKLLDAKRAHEVAIANDKQTIAAGKSKLELLAKIEAGDFTALEAIDPAWYDKASRQQVAKLKPGDPSVVAEQLRAEQKKLQDEIEELRNPKPKPLTPEQIAEMKAQQERGDASLKEQAVAFVKADPKYVELNKEDPKDVADEVHKLMDRMYKDAGSPQTIQKTQLDAWMADAVRRLEVAARAQKELTASQEPGTNNPATGSASGKSGSDKPQNITPRGTDTLTASLGESVPVGERKPTKEERRVQAKALAREMFKSA